MGTTTTRRTNIHGGPWDLSDTLYIDVWRGVPKRNGMCSVCIMLATLDRDANTNWLIVDDGSTHYGSPIEISRDGNPQGVLDLLKVLGVRKHTQLYALVRKAAVGHFDGEQLVSLASVNNPDEPIIVNIPI